MEIKGVDAYYEEMKKLYPTVPEKDLKLILNYGWRSIYRINVNGGDVDIITPKFKCYFGHLNADSLEHFKYYIKKLCIKFRILYNKRKVAYNGYYYFALSDKSYQNYEAQKRKRGRPRKHFNYGNVKLYKIFEECDLQNFCYRYIFRVRMPIEFGFKLYKPNFETDQAELIQVREPLKFKDILVQNRKYEMIYGTKRNS